MKLDTVAESRVQLHTDWEGYEKILEALGDACAVRVTYNQGELEIMTTGHEHEKLKTLLGCLLEVYMDEMDMTFEGGGAETFKRRELEKGFEPDECYWIGSHRAMIGVNKWDPTLHPPPDVGVEIQITHGLVKRLPIFAAIGIAEVWWYHDATLEILILQPGGEYEVTATSPTFPDLSPALMLEHLKLSGTQPTSDILRRFRSILRRRAQKPETFQEP